MATKTKATPVEVTLNTSQQVKLKNRDMIDFQKKTGKSFIAWVRDFGSRLQSAGDDENKQFDAMAGVDWEELTAVLWILGRRSNPAFTWDDALDADLDQNAMTQLVGMIADPTAPADAAAT